MNYFKLTINNNNKIWQHRNHLNDIIIIIKIRKIANNKKENKVKI